MWRTEIPTNILSYIPTDIPTNKPTDTARCRFACPRLKSDVFWTSHLFQCTSLYDYGPNKKRRMNSSPPQWRSCQPITAPRPETPRPETPRPETPRPTTLKPEPSRAPATGAKYCSEIEFGESVEGCICLSPQECWKDDDNRKFEVSSN